MPRLCSSCGARSTDDLLIACPKCHTPYSEPPPRVGLTDAEKNEIVKAVLKRMCLLLFGGFSLMTVIGVVQLMLGLKQARDAAMEVSLHRGAFPQASSVSLAAQLLGKMTSASRAAIRAEHKLILQEALNGMDPIDREVLTLRHIELLSKRTIGVSLVFAA